MPSNSFASGIASLPIVRRNTSSTNAGDGSDSEVITMPAPLPALHFSSGAAHLGGGLHPHPEAPSALRSGSMNVKNLAGLVGSPCFIPFSMAHAAVSPKELVTEYHEPACMRFISSISASGTPYASRVRYTAFIFVDVKAVLKSNCTTTTVARSRFPCSNICANLKICRRVLLPRRPPSWQSCHTPTSSKDLDKRSAISAAQSL